MKEPIKVLMTHMEQGETICLMTANKNLVFRLVEVQQPPKLDGLKFSAIIYDELQKPKGE
jgi:hypothetical protein